MKRRIYGMLATSAFVALAIGASAQRPAERSSRRAAENPALAASERIEKGPYLAQVDTGGVTVCWVTGSDAASSVEYGESDRLGQTAAESMMPRERNERVWAAGGPAEQHVFHQVRLSGLKPDTRYSYRVRTGGTASETFSFRAAPRAGQDFTFLVYGDTRPTPAHRKVIERVMGLDPEPRFAVHTGDLVSNGQQWPDWQGFFDVTAPLLRRIPFYPLLGNHEHNADNYFALFNLPGNESYYSFDVGDVHVVILDSHQNRNDAAQRAWLMQDLKAAYDKPYCVVAFHTPIYTCTNDVGRRVGALDLAREWAPIFEAYEVTAVLNGHDHNYQHNLVNGVHHIVAGGGGASLYPVRPRSFTVKAAQVYSVVEARVGREAMTFRAIRSADGSTIEEFSVPRRDTRPLVE